MLPSAFVFRCAALLLLMLTVVPVAAQTASQEVAQLWRDIDPRGPGCAVAVVRDGKTIYTGAAGLANLEHNVPLTTSSGFKVGSMSKQFTAAAIVLLAQEGKLTLNDDVRMYLPEVPDFGGIITLRHLLHHTSGLRTNLQDIPGRPMPITEDYVLQLVSRQRDLNSRPGEAYAYSNTSYELLAVVVRRVSGQSLREFTAEKIFRPLGMSHTWFSDDHSEVVPVHAHRYRPVRDGWRAAIDAWDATGATGLVTTVEDMAQWAAHLDQPRPGSPELIRQMQKRATLNNGEPADYGYSYGLFLSSYRGLRNYDILGAGAYLMWFPEKRFSVVTLCNGGGSVFLLPPKIAAIYLGSEFPEPPASDPPSVSPAGAELEALTGLYWNEHDDVFVKLEVKDGRLHLVTASASRELVPLGSGVFRIPLPIPGQYLIRFARDESRPKRFTHLFPGEAPMVFTAVAGATPVVSELNDYVGTYFSQEFDLVWRIERDRDRLVLTRLRFPPTPLQPATRDAFVMTPHRTMRFVRDTSGKVSGLRMSSFPPGLQRLRFQKVDLPGSPASPAPATRPRPSNSVPEGACRAADRVDEHISAVMNPGIPTWCTRSTGRLAPGPVGWAPSDD